MEFTEFAEILKPIIGGSYSTHVFTRTLFETIITEDGLLQIEDISENTFKAYYNGKTQVTKITLQFNGTFNNTKSEIRFSSLIQIGSSLSYTTT